MRKYLLAVDSLRKARPDLDRKELHAQASEHWPEGLPASHTEWRNAEMDEWVARCVAITRPESFTTQIRQVRMPQTRWLMAIDHALFALLKERDYAEGIARQMNLRGKMGGPFTTLETLSEDGLEKLFIALKKECRREWPLKEDLLGVIMTAIRDEVATLRGEDPPAEVYGPKLDDYDTQDDLPVGLQAVGWVSPLWHATELGRMAVYGAPVPLWLLDMLWVLMPESTALWAWPGSLPATEFEPSPGRVVWASSLPGNHMGALPVALAPPRVTWLLWALSWPWPLYRAPTTTGRSMSPPRKLMSTSCPMRGRATLPQLAPACGASGVATRTQVPVVEVVSSAAGAPLWPASPAGWARRLWLIPPRCQANCTLMRWSRSVVRWWPGTPTTRAVWLPCTVGLRWIKWPVASESAAR